MGLQTTMIGVPILVLVLSMVAQTGAVSGSNSPVSFINQNDPSATHLTCTSSANACFPGGAISIPPNSIITCSPATVNGITPTSCNLWNGCAGPIPSGAYCQYILWVFPSNVQMDSGTVISVSSNGQTSSQSATASSFNFGAIGAAGFIIIITIGVGIAVLAGLNVFGSGESPEAVHILFISGVLLGIWGVLSATEGFLTGQGTSLFAQMNQGLAGLGTLFYVLLTLMYTIGTLGTISRGS